MAVRRAFGFPFRGLVVTALAGGLMLALPLSATAASRPAGASAGIGTGIGRSESLTPARAGAPYLTYVTGAQSRPGYWSALAGTLPPGLVFNGHTGAVSGLPVEAGSWAGVLEHKGSPLATMFVRITVVPHATAPTAAARTTATTGAIAGIVSSPAGAIVHACVEAVNAAGVVHTGSTTASGAYAISGLTGGKWEVDFSGCGQDYISQWWSDSTTMTTARAVSVTDGKVAGGVDAVLSPGGEIGGIATAAGSTDGLGSVCVYAAPIVQQYQQISSAVTAPSGAYTIAGLSSGGYLVEFAPCSAALDRLGAWWKGQSSASGASVVEVTAGKETPGISASLAQGGAISGTVTSAVTGKPVAGICVATESASPSSEETDLFAPLPIKTNSDGNYLIDGLAPGDYLVEFGPCSGVNTANYLLPTLWSATGALADTPPVVVSAGSTTTGISTALHEGGTFSGTITSSSGRPLSGVCVLAESNAAGLAAEGITDTNGDYSVAGLPNGTYAAVFEPCAGQNYAAAVWKNGATFTVTAGKVTTGISGALATGAEIEGALVSSTGVGLSALCVVLSEKSANETVTVEEGPFGFAGSFSFAGLSAGKYSVGFSGSCIGQNYATTYWDGGKYIAVKAGQVISVALTLPPGGSVTGSVTTPGDAPLSWFCVLATGGAPPALIFAATVGLGGYYDLTGLSSGAYTVEIEPCAEQNLLGTEYDNGSPVAVKEGKTTSGISATLHPGATIAGTVKSATGQALSFLCVTLIDGDEGFGLNDLFGTYSAYGLPAGTYKVEFSSCGAGKFATQWWKDAATRAAATPIVVGAGATVSGIDAVMQS
jgi:hypothetical protein